jgi:hypothetical protein
VPATTGASGVSKSEGSAYLYDVYTPLRHKVRGELLEVQTRDIEVTRDSVDGFDVKVVTETNASPFVNPTSKLDEDGVELVKTDEEIAAEEAKKVYAFSPGYSVVKGGRPSPPEATEQRWAVGLTEGLVASDRDAQAKTVREAHFPPERLEAPLSANLVNGGSSVEADRSRILNSLANEPLDAMPRGTHPRYTEVNSRIRGHIASACLVRSVVEAGKGDTSLFDALLRGLSESDITQLDVSFNDAVRQGISVSAATYEKVLEALPVTIEELSVELPASITKLPNNVLRRLPTLRVIALTNSISVAKLPDDIVECTSLQALDCTGLASLSELPKRLFDLRQLVTLNLTGCKRLGGLASHVGTRRLNISTLILEDCTGIAELSESLANNLVNINMLSLRGCINMQRLPSWVAELERKGVAVQRPFHLE